MKAFITFAIVCLIAISLSSAIKISEEKKAEMKAHFEQCRQQENVSEEDATKLREKDLSNPSSNMKCFAACILEKFGSLKDDVFQEAVVLEKMTPHFGEEKSKAFLDKCKNIKSADRCDIGFEIFECFHKNKSLLELE